MPTLRQLTYLVLLAEERHFGRAARRANVTQPTLSAQLQALEALLGVRLLGRSRAGVVLTPVGRAAVEYARAALREVADLVELARDAREGTAFRGTLRLGVPPTLGPYLLPLIVPRLHRAYPDMKLYVREAGPADLLLRLENGDFDLVLAPAPVGGRDVETTELFDESLLIAAAPDHRLAGRGRIGPAELAGESVLTLEPGHHLHEQVSVLCAAAGAVLRPDYEGTSLDTLRQMAGMGVGLAFLPALYVHSEIRPRGEVAILEVEGQPLQRRIVLAWRRRSVHRREAASFAGLIREVLATGPRGVSVTA